jgi:hypothetical protein
MEDGDGGGSFLGEGAGLIDQFFGEIEGDQLPVTQRPYPECHPAGATTGFHQSRGFVGEKPLDQQPFGFPQAKLIRGTRIMHHRNRVVEVGPNCGRGDFGGRCHRILTTRRSLTTKRRDHRETVDNGESLE